MLRILSRIAQKLGLVTVHVTVIRKRRDTLRVIESTFPYDTDVDVRC